MNPSAADTKRYGIPKNPSADNSKIEMLKHFAAYSWNKFYTESASLFVDIENDAVAAIAAQANRMHVL